MELLLDMVTLANLDCDKLEDELESAQLPGSQGQAAKSLAEP